MTELVVEIPRIKWAKQRTFELDKGFKDATRDYCKRRWPHHTAKYAAREFNLTVDQGRSVANGTASMTTVERCLKIGGPLVAIPIVEEVIGVKLSGFFRETLLNAAAGGTDALEHQEAARSAYRALAGMSGRTRDGGDEPEAAWQARHASGALGAEATRRLANRKD